MPHELDIDRAALQQLGEGVIPWTIALPAGLDPLPFFTSMHIGRALHGYTLNANGNWKAAQVESSDTYPHLMYGAGRLPQLDRDFQYNVDLLLQDLTRSPENGLQNVELAYDLRASCWYRGIVAFPKLYSAALKQFAESQNPVVHAGARVQAAEQITSVPLTEASISPQKNREDQ